MDKVIWNGDNDPFGDSVKVFEKMRKFTLGTNNVKECYWKLYFFGKNAIIYFWNAVHFAFKY